MANETVRAAVEGVGVDEPAAASAPEPVDALETLLRFMYAQPLHREIYYRVLTYCTERRMLEDIERFIMALPEYASATQSPFFIIDDLRAQGALSCIELDENGADVAPEDKEGLDEDEIDDLVCAFAYVDTDLGLEAAEQCNPRARFAKLVGGDDAYEEAYREVMDLLREKHGAGSIDLVLQRVQANAPAGVNIVTSTVISDLEKAGVIVWQKGWTLTEEGRGLLESNQ